MKFQGLVCCEFERDREGGLIKVRVRDVVIITAELLILDFSTSSSQGLHHDSFAICNLVWNPLRIPSKHVPPIPMRLKTLIVTITCTVFLEVLQ